LGPAHYGIGRYALGHDEVGPLSDAGRQLLMAMDRLGIILDATHLSEPTFWNALDLFSGPVWASHHNCRALVDDPRQLSDEQIKALAERGSVIGVAMDVWMVVPNWKRGISNHQNHPGANFSALADHIDHISQYLGIGTDLDGGYGTEQSPSDLDTIADLERFVQILEGRGYDERDLLGICHMNFLRFIREAWSSADRTSV
jgi:membrane dipeptidase